jgi:hypothetical protein
VLVVFAASFCPLDDSTEDAIAVGNDGNDEEALGGPNMSNADDMFAPDADDDTVTAAAATAETAVDGGDESNDDAANAVAAATVTSPPLEADPGAAASSLPGDGRSSGALLLTDSTGLKVRPTLPESARAVMAAGEGSPKDDDGGVADVPAAAAAAAAFGSGCRTSTGPTIDEAGGLSKSNSCPTSTPAAPIIPVAALPMFVPKGTSMSNRDAVEPADDEAAAAAAGAGVAFKKSRPDVDDDRGDGPVANAKSSKLELASALGTCCC